MHKNKTVVITFCVVVLTILIVMGHHRLRHNAGPDQSSDGNYRAGLHKREQAAGWKTITAEEMRNFMAPARPFDDRVIKDCFTGSVVNRDTLQFFHFLDRLFQDSADIAENLERARLYLNAALPQRKARQLFELYKTYIDYQVEMQTRMKEWSITGATMQALDNLARIREYRRAVFGKETAAIIFGAAEKEDEYNIRRRMILADTGLYGLEKERRLRILNEMMWGETMPFDGNLASYARYRDKLSLYSRDLSRATSESQKESILEQLRREIFSADELLRMEKARETSAEEARLNEQYTARRNEILASGLDAETEQNRILDLQDTTFGPGAPAVRRREAIQQGLEEARIQAAREARAAEAGGQYATPEEALENLNRKIQEQQRDAERQPASE